MRQLNAEGILALKPTLVLTSDLAQPALVFRQLADSGVRVVHIPADSAPEAVSEKSPPWPPHWIVGSRDSS